jgi:DNA-binding response OmpR family regulator
MPMRRRGADDRSMDHARILVVEDDPSVSAYVCAILRGAGYDVAAASDLEQATVAAADAPLDVLLSDIVLGRVDGLDVADAVRRLRPAVRTLFMSGYARLRYADGADDPVLAKPFEAPELLRRVERLVSSAA